MKINNDKNIQVNQSIPVQQEKTDRMKEQTEKNKADSLSISSDVAKVSEAAKKVIEKMDEVRTERVQALQKEIDHGTYQVDSRKVADAMLNKAVGTSASEE